jgi:hypothetical protein
MLCVTLKVSCILQLRVTRELYAKSKLLKSFTYANQKIVLQQTKAAIALDDRCLCGNITTVLDWDNFCDDVGKRFGTFLLNSKEKHRSAVKLSSFSKSNHYQQRK